MKENKDYMEQGDNDIDEEPVYPGLGDMPDPAHHLGPLIPPNQYEADMLNFLEHTVADSFYPNLTIMIEKSLLTAGAKAKLQFLADKYVKPIEYVITNVRDNRQYRSIQNDFRMDAANAKVGLRRIDYGNIFTSVLSAIENHLKGAKLTRSYMGFERVSQQTQRAELSSSYEHKKPPQISTGISRLMGRR